MKSDINFQFLGDTNIVDIKLFIFILVIPHSTHVSCLHSDQVSHCRIACSVSSGAWPHCTQTSESSRLNLCKYTTKQPCPVSAWHRWKLMFPWFLSKYGSICRMRAWVHLHVLAKSHSSCQFRLRYSQCRSTVHENDP